MAGFGGLPWGYGWGGASSFGGSSGAPVAEDFGIYCFTGIDMAGILANPDAVTVDAGGQISISAEDDLVLVSGGAASTEDARFSLTTAVPLSWTLQFTVRLDDLPNDFSALITNHIFVGTSDVSGACAGLFISQAGLAYTGGISHGGLGNMQIDSVVEILPGSAAFVSEGEYITFRIAADTATSVVYIYVTRAVDVPGIGHQLRYILPLITAAELANSPIDRTHTSVRGTGASPSQAAFDQLCLADGLVIPNLPPRADAGADQAIRTCNIVRLNGTASFDPEGAPLLYQWLLVDAPEPSAFCFEGNDGITLPEAAPSGFTDRFYSEELSAEHTSDALTMGDVLLVGNATYVITSIGVDGNGFYVQTSADLIPDNFTGALFKVLRQRGISDAITATPTFFPDAPGIYRFSLFVSDGDLVSEESLTLVNVLESLIPKGCTPDLGFLWNYLSDFWRLVEDRERIDVFFQALAQVVASEILTLWQVDYSKSLRDIQRTFQRRWLHYDLLLGEPIPELTQVRSVFGGVTSSLFDGAGLAGITGTKVVISSPLFTQDLTVTFASADPVTLATFVAELTTKLTNQDSRFSAIELPTTGGAGYARIDASIPFTISSETTVPVFTVGDTNEYPSGSGGLRLGIRTYRVEISLEGLDILEHDLLLIDGEAYSIQRIVDDPADPQRYQRVVVHQDLPTIPGSTWEIPGHIVSRLLNFRQGLVAPEDIVYLEVFEVATQRTQLIQTTALGVSEAIPGKLALELTAVSTYLAQPTLYKVTLAKVIRRSYVPIDALVLDVPCLQSEIATTDDSQVLRRNIDYFHDTFRGQPCLRFVVGSDPDPDVWEYEVPPPRLWAELTFIDNEPTIEGNFGIPVEFTLDNLEDSLTNVDYLSAVRGLWYAHLNGPTLYNLRVGTQILLGLPFAEEVGTIEEIRTDFSSTQGRILVRDKSNIEIVRSYSYPAPLSLEVNPETGAVYQVGDLVEQFAPLVQGADVLDYVKDPAWFEGLLNQDSFFEVEKFFKFMVRVDSAAFSLSTLLFVKNFILKIKPTYTYPLFVVRSELEVTEVSVTDDVTFSGTLTLHDGACFAGNPNGMATMFDQARSAGGGWFNDFDGNIDPDDTPVEDLYPVVQTVGWAFDKKYLCPEDDIQIAGYTNHAGGVIADIGFFTDGQQVLPIHLYKHGAMAAVAIGPAGTTLTGSPSTVGSAGTVDEVYLAIHGGLDGDPDDYELVIEHNGVTIEALPFTAGATGFVGTLAASGFAVVGTDTIALRIRPASGGARTPTWVDVYARVHQSSVTWTVGGALPAGYYCSIEEAA